MKLMEVLFGCAAFAGIFYVPFLIISKDDVIAGGESLDPTPVGTMVLCVVLLLIGYFALGWLQQKFYPKQQRGKTKIGDPR
ncbi:MAG: hypothetical protein AAF386_00890 [Pseudomonadota bacterium]